jgi:surfeit locus 1 family protein
MARRSGSVSALSPAARSRVVLVATLVGMAATAALGAWQLDRAAQKAALQRSVAERATMPVLGASDLALRDDVRAQYHRRIRVTGQWIAKHTVFLDNRQMNGRPGLFVITPLRLAGSNDVIVVQRGWVPRDAADRTRLPPLPTPAGEVSVTGRLAPPPSRLYEFSRAASGPIRQNLDMAQYAVDIGVPLAPLSLVQDAGPDDGLLRQWAPPAIDIHKHYGYAVQWFALCTLLAGLYVWHQLIRPRQRHG